MKNPAEFTDRPTLYLGCQGGRVCFVSLASLLSLRKGASSNFLLETFTRQRLRHTPLDITNCLLLNQEAYIKHLCCCVQGQYGPKTVTNGR